MNFTCELVDPWTCLGSRLKDLKLCFGVIYHLKLQQSSFSCVFWQFFFFALWCLLSNVVAMTKWWVPSIVVSDRAAAAELSTHFHMWLLWSAVRSAVHGHVPASSTVFSSAVILRFKAAFPWDRQKKSKNVDCSLPKKRRNDIVKTLCLMKFGVLQ